MRLIAKTLLGAEQLLANELQELGATEIATERRAVTCTADKETLYRICYTSRIAMRVMVKIAEFAAENEDEVYEEVKKIGWHELIGKGKSLYIDHVSFSSKMSESGYIAEKVADGIIDEMMNAEGRQPRFASDGPDIMLNVHATDERVTVSMDAVGAPLSYRGYRDETIDAATNEVLSAILVDLSGWTPKQALVDPMCGAGTICIEAAMKAKHIPAAKYRRYAFGFESFSDFDAELWNKVREEADSKISNIRLNIVGSDVDTDATDLAKTTTLEMKLTQEIRISRKSIKEQQRMTQEGVIVTCPPSTEEETRHGLVDFYKEMTYHLSHNFPDYDVWIYSPAKDAMDEIDFTEEKTIEVHDGVLKLSPF